ncbi:MAG: SDR family oxidoreductase [Victivallales bacterium]
MLNIDLTGRIALVIGGSRGIGSCITELCCKAGALTYFTHTERSVKEAQALSEKAAADNGKAIGRILDACDSEKTKELVDGIAEQHGALDILVVNVGKNLARPSEEITDEEWREFIDINLTSAFYAQRAVLPHMVKNHYGKIIFIGSSAFYNGGGGAIDYATAKAGIHGMVVYLAKEYARKGIRTNAIHPAVIVTDLLKKRYDTEEKLTSLRSQIPVGRLGRPEDIAGMAVYLASEWGDYICGQSILIDGGRTMFR